jgi:7,8-dihydroneopterin aldolase/epimerase/oxygenase
LIDVELFGLRIFGHHGVTEDERERGRDFLFDLRLTVSEAALSDQIEDAVDYREIAQCVRDVSDGRRYSLLETLAAAAADEILNRFPVERVRLRVRKPEVHVAGLEAEWSAASVERTRSAARRTVS